MPYSQYINDGGWIENNTFPIDLTGVNPNEMDICLQTVFGNPVDLEKTTIILIDLDIYTVTYSVRVVYYDNSAFNFPQVESVLDVSVCGIFIERVNINNITWQIESQS